jgi:4-hydroxy-2-oxoheptanedioate aldolase
MKQRLTGDAVLRGVAQVIPSAVATQAIASAGADFVMIDREHGPIGREALHAMIAATAGTDCAALVRATKLDASDVKIALDAGAEGIVYPLVRSASDVERCVAYLTYPPGGARGFGPFAAHSRFGTSLGDYSAKVGGNVMCGLLIETREAVENVTEIVRVPGIDVIVPARFDLSIALGVAGQFDAPEYTDSVSKVEQAVLAQGIALGGIAFNREEARLLIARGYRLILHGFDALMLKDQVAAFRTWT